MTFNQEPSANKSIDLAIAAALLGVIFLCPLGLGLAAAFGLVAFLTGAWAVNSSLIFKPYFVGFGLVNGFASVVCACIGLVPDSGTLAFGSGSPSFIVTLPSQGTARAEFSFWVLTLLCVPTIAGAAYAIFVNRLSPVQVGQAPESLTS